MSSPCSPGGLGGSGRAWHHTDGADIAGISLERPRRIKRTKHSRGPARLARSCSPYRHCPLLHHPFFLDAAFGEDAVFYRRTYALATLPDHPRQVASRPSRRSSRQRFPTTLARRSRSALPERPPGRVLDRNLRRPLSVLDFPANRGFDDNTDRNPRTRKSYRGQIDRFLRWAEARGLGLESLTGAGCANGFPTSSASTTRSSIRRRSTSMPRSWKWIR